MKTVVVALVVISAMSACAEESAKPLVAKGKRISSDDYDRAEPGAWRSSI